MTNFQFFSLGKFFHYVNISRPTLGKCSWAVVCILLFWKALRETNWKVRRQEFFLWLPVKRLSFVFENMKCSQFSDHKNHPPPVLQVNSDLL